MYNRFILGSGNFSMFAMAISIAASWAWGVSVIVGIQVFQNKGVEAFTIWAAANALTLAVFGFAAAKISKDVRKLPEILPGNLKPVYSGFQYLIQFFSILVNLTAIKTAVSMIGYTNNYSWLFLGTLLVLGVVMWGFPHVIQGNMAKYVLWIGLLLTVIFMSGHGIIIKHSASADISWGLYGALILFCGPVMDQQMWQRRAAFGGNTKPFILASVFFGIYMLLVGSVAAVSAGKGMLIATIVFLVAASTLTSAASAISYFHSNIKSARIAIATVFLIAAICMIFNLSVLQIWVLYGSLRIPFALFAFYRIFKH